jgi:hypothetical protein
MQVQVEGELCRQAEEEEVKEEVEEREKDFQTKERGQEGSQEGSPKEGGIRMSVKAVLVSQITSMKFQRTNRSPLPVDFKMLYEKTIPELKEILEQERVELIKMIDKSNFETGYCDMCRDCDAPVKRFEAGRQIVSVCKKCLKANVNGKEIEKAIEDKKPDRTEIWWLDRNTKEEVEARIPFLEEEGFRVQQEPFTSTSYNIPREGIKLKLWRR